MRATFLNGFLGLLSLIVVAGDLNGAAVRDGAGPVPVIYCTDLFHPHEDPDDHFDLAALYAMPELDVKGIVLDQGARQLQRPGRIPVSQMNKIAGRAVPTAIGLADPLKAPNDKALNQPAEFQKGVELILTTLRTSTTPVRIAAVGSVRDVVAAFNREPELFRTQVVQILAFIGEASKPGFREYNVGLDPQAYVGLLRSRLPVYWVPCFDGGPGQNRGHASFWRARQQTLLQHAAPELIQYFIYALEKEKSDPLAFLSAPVDPKRQARLLADTRNLWCTAIFGVMSGREVVFDGTNFVSIRPTRGAPPKPPPGGALFGFAEVELSVSDAAEVRYGRSPDSRKVMRFEIRDAARFEEGMTRVTAGLLSDMGQGRSAAAR